MVGEVGLELIEYWSPNNSVTKATRRLGGARMTRALPARSSAAAQKARQLESGGKGWVWGVHLR